MIDISSYAKYLVMKDDGWHIKKGTPKNIIERIKQDDLEYYKIYGERFVQEGYEK